ncbi:SAM-dependent methyltransferase [Fodinibius salsisoli]|uniref:Class I SAM-dependent methyltransferase n=1 Tax=Fodinibius salsisoli TaxID=2820877 RepID=A0ABT3PRS8_9BACT|nr:class I SAM-dependent methyltransferase [Fodinibius salsisoli]MCW9708567.1 class I SAM-dependent methyltransferase [Fodinibius salsisoli]
MDWFEEWFDSPLYEQLYADRDEEEARRLVNLLTQTLPLEKCSKILDLGCGRGRHAINLYREGYDVTGIDLSEQAIATAREKAEALDAEHLRFEVRDMRNPLPMKFDAIVNLFTTFGYFETEKENASVFDSIVQMLKPGGVFVLDYLNAAKVRRSIQPSDEGAFHGIDYKIRRYIKDDAVHKEIKFKGDGDHVEGTKTYSERVKLYELPWFKETMHDRGLVIDQIYGDYEGNEFNPDTSSRLLIISHLEEDGKSER